VNRDSALLAPLAAPDRFTLVAGSTWPADEAQLLPAWARLVRRNGARRPRLIIAPHEPTAAHVAPVERWASGEGLNAARAESAAARDADVIIVDRVGVLGDLYALADVAFVGGGFHAAGLHSVLEPAAFGAPVLFGPRHQASRDATLLLDADAALAADDDGSVERAIERWLTDSGARRAAGDAARTVVHRGLGAAERSWRLVETLLPA
jgi:3-deoxy-D-manno-octulosonic-acid transferase